MGDRLLIFGDICTDNQVRKLIDEGKSVFSEELQELMRSVNYIIGNLECPATNVKKPIVKCGPNLKALPEDIDYLKMMGFKALSLANNHILDYGEEAVIETLSVCDRYGMDYFGAGACQKKACLPYILETNHGRIGFLSFAEEEFNIASSDSPGAALFDPYGSFDIIKALKDTVDRIVVFYHGGIEHYIYPTPLLQKKCRKIIESGADVVLCQHSHCIGTIENHANGTIVYGQGNSVFGYRAGDNNWNEGLLVDIDLSTFELKYHLLNATDNGVILADEDVCINRVAKVMHESENIYNDEYIRKSWRQFVKKNEALYYPLLYGKGRIFNKLNRILNNKLAAFFIKKNAQMITMNLIRCDAHREVVTTMLETKVYE